MSGSEERGHLGFSSGFAGEMREWKGLENTTAFLQLNRVLV